MPNKQNAKKALRQARKRALDNIIVKKAYKAAVKNVVAAVGTADITTKVREVQKKLAKAAKKGVLKKNTAARKLSRLMKKINTAVKK